jgi:Zn-finger nucleic acid-binding protein
MDCFRCRQAMKKANRDGVLVDACDTCGGVWLDAGELEVLERKEAQGRSELVRQARQEVAEESRQILKVVGLCPKCQRVRLKQVVKRGVQLDFCPDCQGLFFDDRELERALKASKDETRGGFLGSVLALFRGGR